MLWTVLQYYRGEQLEVGVASHKSDIVWGVVCVCVCMTICLLTYHLWNVDGRQRLASQAPLGDSLFAC